MKNKLLWFLIFSPFLIYFFLSYHEIIFSRINEIFNLEVVMRLTWSFIIPLMIFKQFWIDEEGLEGVLSIKTQHKHLNWILDSATYYAVIISNFSLFELLVKQIVTPSANILPKTLDILSFIGAIIVLSHYIITNLASILKEVYSVIFEESDIAEVAE